MHPLKAMRTSAVSSYQPIVRISEHSSSSPVVPTPPTLPSYRSTHKLSRAETIFGQRIYHQLLKDRRIDIKELRTTGRRQLGSGRVAYPLHVVLGYFAIGIPDDVKYGELFRCLRENRGNTAKAFVTSYHTREHLKNVPVNFDALGRFHDAAMNCMNKERLSLKALSSANAPAFIKHLRTDGYVQEEDKALIALLYENENYLELLDPPPDDPLNVLPTRQATTAAAQSDATTGVWKRTRRDASDSSNASDDSPSSKLKRTSTGPRGRFKPDFILVPDSSDSDSADSTPEVTSFRAAAPSNAFRVQASTMDMSASSVTSDSTRVQSRKIAEPTQGLISPSTRMPGTSQATAPLRPHQFPGNGVAQSTTHRPTRSTVVEPDINLFSTDPFPDWMFTEDESGGLHLIWKGPPSGEQVPQPDAQHGTSTLRDSQPLFPLNSQADYEAYFKSVVVEPTHAAVSSTLQGPDAHPWHAQADPRGLTSSQGPAPENHQDLASDIPTAQPTRRQQPMQPMALTQSMTLPQQQVEASAHQIDPFGSALSQPPDDEWTRYFQQDFSSVLSNLATSTAAMYPTDPALTDTSHHAFPMGNVASSATALFNEPSPNQMALWEPSSSWTATDDAMWGSPP